MPFIIMHIIKNFESVEDNDKYDAHFAHTY